MFPAWKKLKNCWNSEVVIMKYQIGVLLALLFVFVEIMMGCVSENGDPNPDNNPWLDTYEPVHSIGQGEDTFWIDYPPENPSYGMGVTHFSWVFDSLEEGCVLFVVHKTGCVGCQAQADRVIELGQKYGAQIQFYDLDMVLGGDIEDKAYEVYRYDPDGPPGYIALTGIITLIEVNGTEKQCWHSWEGNMGYDELEGWIRDGIYYHHLLRGE